jgi:hypothetical protein
MGIYVYVYMDREEIVYIYRDETKKLPVPDKPIGKMEFLDKMGGQGWEMCGETYNVEHEVFYFKRRK